MGVPLVASIRKLQNILLCSHYTFAVMRVNVCSVIWAIHTRTYTTTRSPNLSTAFIKLCCSIENYWTWLYGPYITWFNGLVDPIREAHSHFSKKFSKKVSISFWPFNPFCLVYIKPITIFIWHLHHVRLFNNPDTFQWLKIDIDCVS